MSWLHNASTSHIHLVDDSYFKCACGAECDVTVTSPVWHSWVELHMGCKGRISNLKSEISNQTVTWWTVVWMVLKRLIALGIAVGGAACILAWWPVFRLPAAAAGPFAVVWAAGMLWIFLRK